MCCSLFLVQEIKQSNACVIRKKPMLLDNMKMCVFEQKMGKQKGKKEKLGKQEPMLTQVLFWFLGSRMNMFWFSILQKREQSNASILQYARNPWIL